MTPITESQAPDATRLAIDSERRAHRLAVGFLALAALTWVLIVLGALVRANDAGLACPDWPLCFGEVVPHFDLPVAFEWGHRALAGSVSLFFLGLAWASLRRPGPLRRAAAAWIATGALLLGVQVILGALTVWQLLASWTVTSHLITGNAFAACLLLTSRRLKDLAEATARPALLRRALRPVATATGVLLGVQMVLGGLVASRYVGLACPDWPACIDGVWFPSFEGALGTHLSHRIAGYALFAGLALSAWLGRGEPRSGRLLGLALGLGGLQVVVGISNVLLRLPVEVTGLHSALAAALVLTFAVSLRELWLSPAPSLVAALPTSLATSGGAPIDD